MSALTQLPPTITLSPNAKNYKCGTNEIIGKTIAQLRGGSTASAGSIVAVSDNSYRSTAYFDSLRGSMYMIIPSV